MKKLIKKSPRRRTGKLAAFVTAAALGTLMMTSSPASATQYAYAVQQPSSSAISGDVWTKFFSAKINLIEWNNQLMLSKVALDPYYRQYVSEPYPIAFNFQGKDWSADLVTPVRMSINNSFNANGSYDSVIRANVNFTSTEFGQTTTRPALATLHLVQAENWNHNGQMLSLEIVDVNEPSNVLYNSGSNLTMDRRSNVLTAFLPLVTGHFDAKVFAQGNTAVAYGAPVNYPAYGYNNDPIYWNNNAGVYGYNFQPMQQPIQQPTVIWPNNIAMN